MVVGKIQKGKRPQTVWGAGSQSTKYRQQQPRNSNRSGSTLSQLQRRELVLAQEAALCLLIRISYQNLIPGHLTEFKRSLKKDLLYRGSHKICRQEFPMSIPEELADKHQRSASSRSQCKDLLRRVSTRSPLFLFSQGPVQDHARTSERIAPGSLHDLLTRTCRRP